MLESFKENLKAVGHWWWILITGVVAGIMFIANLFGFQPRIAWPIGLAIIFFAFSTAQFLAYHNLRKSKNKQEWEYTREKHIELANQFVPNIESILNKMRARMEILLDKASQRGTTEETLKQFARKVSPYTGLFISNDETENLEYYLRFTSEMDAAHIGLGTDEDTEWILLERELNEQHNPDGKLRVYISQYRTILCGVYSHMLLDVLLSQQKNKVDNDSLPIRGKKGGQATIDKAMQRVRKRIDELRCGEEPT
jgi:hypothetical protein